MKSKVFKCLMLLCVCLISAGITGCEEKTEKTELLPIDTIKYVVIETADNDIIIENADTNDIKASMIGHEGVLLVQEGDTAHIKLPMTKGGIHLSSPPPLKVYIPGDKIASLTANSEYGNIKIAAVKSNITVNAEHGSISTSGLQGMITAKTETGGIKSEIISKDAIITGSDDIGASYAGMAGESTSNYKVNLYTTYGNIEIK